MAQRSQLFSALAEFAEQNAYEIEGYSTTYAQLELAARRYAAGLISIGLMRGARVATLCGSRLELIIANLGHYLAGLIHVPINTRYRGAEVAHILDDCDAAAIMLDRPGRDVLEGFSGSDKRVTIGLDGALCDHEFDALLGIDILEAATPTLDAIAMLIYTSGTTGPSKGVEFTLGAIEAGIGALTRLWGWTNADRLCLTLPLFHVHGLGIGVHGGLLSGVTTLLEPRFSPALVVRAFAERGATLFMGVPTMYAMLIDHLEASPQDAQALSRARLFTSGSAALPETHFHRFEQLTGHQILERYGMSETLLTLSNPLQGERRAGSVGQPVPGYEVRLVNEAGAECAVGEPGEIRVRGAGLLHGYWNQPELTAGAFDKRGYFRTGDIARRDADGYVHILGRNSTDIIKSGGYKISTREIEDVLARHPTVREVAVFGIPDSHWGQIVIAAVVPIPGASINKNDLIAHVDDSIASYKKPRRIVVLDELPRNALGKVQKRQLMDHCST